jgi:Glu/Leu/Phe/Val dehydrogenase, dimerisation domain
MFELIDEWGPEKVVCVSDARTGMRGVLVIDNTARGMGKGGTRMSTTVTVGEVARLARNMTWKWAGVDLFFGGARLHRQRGRRRRRRRRHGCPLLGNPARTRGSVRQHLK